MKATMTKRTWTITVEFGNEILRAPDELDPDTGKSIARHWLPCEHCGELQAVKATIASVICQKCALPCDNPECGLAVYEHYDAEGKKTPCEPVQPWDTMR